MASKLMVKLSSAGIMLVSSMALAGGIEVPPQTLFPSPPDTFFYVGGSGGFATSNWEDFGVGKYVNQFFNQYQTNIGPTNFEANDSGYIAGIEAGWQFHPNFGVEIGGYNMFDGDQVFDTGPIQQTTINNAHYTDPASSYFVYGAATLTVPLYKDRVKFFTKVGPAYRHIGHDVECTVTPAGSGSTNCADYSNILPPTDNITDGHYWSALVGAGLDFKMTQHFALDLQWLHVPGNDTDGDSSDFYENEAPAVNAVLATVVYRLYYPH